MKKQWSIMGIILLVIAGSLISCKETSTDTSGRIAVPEPQEKLSTDIVENQTVITFERDLHNFGDIVQGDKVRTEFAFTNTGKHDLLISDAYGSCGCTVPQWPKEPIPPGGSGVIKVEFDSGKRTGQISKTVTVVANTVPSNSKLVIKGTIITK